MDSLTRSRTHGSRVSVSHGEDALRSYLAWDGHARAAHMDPDAFASWLEQSVLQYLTANRASLLRARADGVRRLHAPTLDPLTHALERAEAAYASSAEGARIERATHAVAHRRAAVIGIEAFLGKDRSGESPEMANKQTSARAKLTDARASLPPAERELADAVASSPLWRAREAARAAVTAEREATGLAAADADAREASTAGGNSLVTKGDDYEKTCADVVMAMLRDDPTGGTLGLDLGGSIGAEASSDKGAGLLLLRNVTLGLHSGELDCVLVRVNRESAFVDKIPQDGDGTTGRRTLIRRGRTRTADDEVEDEKKPPAAEVLAVFEFKRNPDDVARGFHSRQTTLGWLAGDERSYDAGEWRNRRHPSGHFNRGYHPMKATSWVSAEKFPETSGCDQKGRRAVVLTRDSFRGFRRHGGFYLDGVWLVTRPRTMCGLDAKVSRERDCFFWFLVLFWLFPVTRHSGLFWSTYLGRDSAGSARILRTERVLHSLTDI